MNGPWSQSWMREICTSGLMSGIWKRNGMTVTAPDLDSTKSLEICERCRLWQRNSPATPENSTAFWRGEFKNSLFDFTYFKTAS